MTDRTMRRVFAALVLAATLTVATSTPASAHTDAQANAVCDWMEVLSWGDGASRIYQIRNEAVHLWGRHQAFCVYDSFSGFTNPVVDHWCLLYDFGNGYFEWFADCLN